MTFDSESPRPWVEVVEKTFILAVPGQDGKPARETYTIREHLGDTIQPLPGGLKIIRPPQDIEREGEIYRVRGQEITINAALLVGIETNYRLERRERLSAKEMMQRASIDVNEAEAIFRRAQTRREAAAASADPTKE